jgi:hypothetical protein
MCLSEPQASLHIDPKIEYCRCLPEGPGVLVGATLAHAAPQSDQLRRLNALHLYQACTNKLKRERALLFSCGPLRLTFLRKVSLR